MNLGVPDYMIFICLIILFLVIIFWWQSPRPCYCIYPSPNSFQMSENMASLSDNMSFLPNDMASLSNDNDGYYYVLQTPRRNMSGDLRGDPLRIPKREFVWNNSSIPEYEAVPIYTGQIL